MKVHVLGVWKEGVWLKIITNILIICAENVQLYCVIPVSQSNLPPGPWIILPEGGKIFLVIFYPPVRIS